MARKKKLEREVDEFERLQKEVRQLKAQNRQLLQRLKKVDREYAAELEEAKTFRAVEEEYERTSGDRPVPCTHCGKGNIVTVDILGRKFQKCNACDWKSGRKIS